MSDPTCYQRAQKGYDVIAAFSNGGMDYDDALAELLQNLMHWAEADGQNFDNELQRATQHYIAQRAEEAGIEDIDAETAYWDGYEQGYEAAKAEMINNEHPS